MERRSGCTFASLVPSAQVILIECWRRARFSYVTIHRDAGFASRHEIGRPPRVRELETFFVTAQFAGKSHTGVGERRQSLPVVAATTTAVTPRRVQDKPSFLNDTLWPLIEFLFPKTARLFRGRTAGRRVSKVAKDLPER
jgi:hypothetical protein